MIVGVIDNIWDNYRSQIINIKNNQYDQYQKIINTFQLILGIISVSKISPPMINTDTTIYIRIFN